MGIVVQQSTRNVIVSYLGVGLGFLNLVVLYPWILSDDEFGLTRLLIALAVLGAQLGQLGSDNVMLRFFPYFRGREHGEGGFVRYVFLVGGTGLAVLLALFFLLRPEAIERFSDSTSLFEKYYGLLFPLLFVEVFFILLRAYARSLRQSVAPVFLREFLLRALQTGLILTYWVVPMSFNTFMIGYTAVYLVCTVALFAFLVLRGSFIITGSPLPRASFKKHMMLYGGFSMVSGMASMLMGNIDQVMIGVLLADSLPYVAYYSVAFFIATLILIPGRAIGQIAFPVIADAWKKNDHDLIQDIYTRSALSQLVVGGALYLMVLFGLDSLLTLLPPPYAQGKNVVLWVGAAQLMSTSIGMNGGILMMSKSYRFDAFVSVFLIVTNVGLNYVLISAYGIEGAALATFISIGVVNVVRVAFLQQKYSLWPFDHRTGRALLVLVGIGGLALLVPKVDNAIVDIVLHGVFIGVLVLLAIRFLHVAPDLNDLLDRTALRWAGSRQGGKRQ